jgi:hypothetical protein
MRTSNPFRVLALAIVVQAMRDYRNGGGTKKSSAASFLATDGKAIIELLGLRPSLIDEFLSDPARFGSLRYEPTDRGGKK